MASEKGCPPGAAGRCSTNGAPREGSGSPCKKKQSPPPAIGSGKRIREILKNGSRISGGFLSLSYMSRGPEGGVRLAVLVPKRTGPAAKRNRIRRILKEEFRLSGRADAAPVDVVMMWRADIEPGSDATAREEAARLLRRLKF